MSNWTEAVASNPTVDNVTTGAPPPRPDCNLFLFVVWGVAGGCVCIFGFFGNSLSIVAFQRDRRSSASTLLQSLAVSDFTLLTTVFFSDALPYACGYTRECSNFWYTWPYIRYIWIGAPVSHMCSIWLVVLIAFNRYWAVCRPHTTHEVWTICRTRIYIFAIVFVVILFNLPRFFEYEIVSEVRNNRTVLVERLTPFGRVYAYKIIYKSLLVNILLILLPILLLISLTWQIVYNLHKRQAKISKTIKNGDKKNTMSRDVTFILTTVVVVAIICQAPLCVFHFVRYAHDFGCGDATYYLDNISKLLVNINSSFNFVIYCMFSNKFRSILVQTLTCKTNLQLEPSVTSNKANGDRGGAVTPKNSGNSLRPPLTPDPNDMTKDTPL